MAKMISLAYLWAVSSIFICTVAEPVQYCRFGHSTSVEYAEVDFCMGLTMHHNLTSNAHDMYLTMVVTRSSELGWTAIGTGPLMAGSLMVIIYGDPYSDEPPIVSIRTSHGHHQPTLISRDDLGEADLRLLQTRWEPIIDDKGNSTKPAYRAQVALVCYSCHQWSGSPILAHATSQPWIWAWNDNQKIPVYSYDAHLSMHKHHVGNGGWGNFYVDMSRSINNARILPSLPPIRPQVQTLGTSDSPMSAAGMVDWLKAKPLVHLHGFLMGFAFLALYPLGIFAMRSGSSRSFRYHWIIQLVASLSTGAGAVIGIVMAHSLCSLHQAVGLGVSATLAIQGILGWRHHFDFLRIRRRTWTSHIHIWYGRLIMIAGWGNFISGLLIGGYALIPIITTASLVVVEVIGVTFWVWSANRRKARQTAEDEMAPPPPWKGEQNEYFALGTDDSEQDQE